MALHLIGYGSVPILRSVFFLSFTESLKSMLLEVNAVDDDVKHGITVGYRHLTTVSSPWNISLGTSVG